MATSLENLANLYRAQKREAEASALEARAKAIRGKARSASGTAAPEASARVYAVQGYAN